MEQGTVVDGNNYKRTRRQDVRGAFEWLTTRTSYTLCKWLLLLPSVVTRLNYALFFPTNFFVCSSRFFAIIETKQNLSLIFNGEAATWLWGRNCSCRYYTMQVHFSVI